MKSASSYRVPSMSNPTARTAVQSTCGYKDFSIVAPHLQTEPDRFGVDGLAIENIPHDELDPVLGGRKTERHPAGDARIDLDESHGLVGQHEALDVDRPDERQLATDLTDPRGDQIVRLDDAGRRLSVLNVEPTPRHDVDRNGVA